MHTRLLRATGPFLDEAISSLILRLGGSVSKGFLIDIMPVAISGVATRVYSL
jgi:hypothetical protein